MSQIDQLSLKSVKSSDLIQKLKAKFENAKRENSASIQSTSSLANHTIKTDTFSNSNILQNENRILKEQIQELKKELEVSKNQSFNSFNSTKRNQLLEVDLKSSKSSSSKKKAYSKPNRNKHRNKNYYHSSDDTSENSYLEDISVEKNLEETPDNQKSGGDKFMFSLICKIDPLHIMRINFFSSTSEHQNQQQQSDHIYENHSHSQTNSHCRRKKNKNDQNLVENENSY